MISLNDKSGQFRLISTFLALLLLEGLLLGAWQIKDKLLAPPAIHMEFSAEGTVRGEPNQASFSFTLEAEGKDTLLLQKQINDQATALYKLLEKEGIKKEGITTTNFRLFPRYDYIRNNGNNQRVFAAYVISHTTRITCPLQKAGKLLSTVVEKGARHITALELTIDNQEEKLKQARTLAIKKAQKKAQEVAKNLNKRLGKLTSYTETTNLIPAPRPLYQELKTGGNLSSVPIAPGSQNITVHVRLSYQLK